MTTFLKMLAPYRKMLLLGVFILAVVVITFWMIILPLVSSHPKIIYVKPGVTAFPALITKVQSGEITVQPFTKSLDTSDPRTLIPSATTTYFTNGAAVSKAVYQQEVTAYNSEELKAAQGDATAEKFLENNVYPAADTVASTTYSALSVGDTVLVYTSGDANKSDRLEVTSVRILNAPTVSPGNSTSTSTVSIVSAHTSLVSMLFSDIAQPLLTKIAFAGGATPHQGILYFNGVWRSNVFWCDSGYTLTGYHDQAGNGNDLTWYACEGSNAPTAGLSASPSSISPGQSLTLTWTSTAAYSCSINNGVNTGGATSGSASVSPGSTTTYTLSCTDNVTTTTSTATVTILVPPTATLTANPTSIIQGQQQSVLTWSSTNATSCTVSNGVYGPGGITAGALGTGLISNTTTYTLTCTGAGGSATAYATVTVVPPAPTATLSANPVSITQGQQSVLSWSSTNATFCTVDNGVYSGSVTTGALGAEPNTTTTYTLTCTGAGGTATASATVYVTPLSPNLYPGTPANVSGVIGQPVTLSYSVINGGNGTSGTSQNIFWIDNSSGNWAGAAYTYAGPIAPGGSQLQTTTYTWNNPGTYIYTECVNLSGGGGPTYTCGNAGTVTITAPDITAATGGAVTGTVGVPFNGFNGTIYNTGNASAAAFNSSFQICDGNCATVNTFIGGKALTSSLAPGANRAITSSSGSYTPTAAGALYYRLCGNMYTNGTNQIAESNYGNDCGAWQNFTVGNPPAPDLTAVTGSAINTTIGNTVGLGGAVYNNGNAATSGSFNNLFQVSLSDQATVVDNENTVLGTMASGGGIGTSVQSSYNFPNPGTYYYRLCANNNYAAGGGWAPTVSESNYNNNCGAWSPITVTAPNITAATGGAVTGTVGVPFSGFTGRVYNTGNADAPAFPNVFQICDGSCSAVNTFVNSQDFILAAGVSRAITPATGASYTPTSNTQLYYRACGDMNTSGATHIAESNYGDNCGAWQNFTVTQPNLYPGTPANVTGVIGQPVTLSYNVINGGTASTPGTFPNIFWIDNSSGNWAGNAYTTAGPLAPGASQIQTTTYTWNTPGTYIYTECVNLDGSGGGPAYVCGNAGTVTIVAPDLTAATGAALSGIAGQSISLGGTVTNSGNYTTGAGFYNNFQVTYSDQATVLANDVVYANALGVSASQHMIAPQVFSSPGTYYYRLCADNNAGFQGTITESNEGNNCSAWKAVTISAPSGAISASPNPCTITSGSACSTTVSWTANSTADQVWVSQNGGTQTDFSNGSGSGSATAPWIGSPPNYFDFYLYDYTSGSRGALLGQVHVTSLEANITAATGAALTGVYQQPLTLSGTVTNTGSATATNFPSVIQICDGNCATVNSTIPATTIGSLGAGSSAGVSASYTPTSMNQLYYRVCGDVNTSWQNVISESNYGDNCSGFQTLSVTEPNITATTGGVVTGIVGVPVTSFTGTVSNSGSATAPAFPNVFQICDNNCATINTFINSQDFGLASGASRAVTPSVGVSYTPVSTTQLYYRLCGDTNTSGNPIITESNYGDNCGAWQYFNVGEADLTATVGSAVSVVPSQSYTFTGTVTNGGTAATTGGFWNLLQICNGTGSCSTYNDATQEAWLGTLGNGAASSVSITDTAPSTAGAYSYRICANDNTSWVNTVSETNYSNNCSGWQTLTVAYPAVGGTCSVSPSSNVYTGQSVTWSSSPSGGNGTYTYQWGGNVSGSTQNVTTSYSSSGSYTGQVLVTSAGLTKTLYCSPGGTGSPIVVMQPVAPSCSVTPTNPVVGQTVTYTATPGAGDNGVFNWTESDGYTTTGNPITRTFSTVGNYAMQVTSNGSPAGYCSNIVVGCAGTPTPVISAASTRINQGASDVLTFSGQNVNTSCVLTGNGTTLQTYTPTSQCTVAQNTYTASNIQNQTKFCYACDGGTPVCTIVNVIPKFNEF